MSFSEILIRWYSANKRDMPWRGTQNPYCIWLSEIILQQTQIKQGLPYYETFVAHFPSVFDLANAEEETILKLWQGLGYYSRARNLHHAAKYIVNELNGEFPKTHKELLALKGVGDYTASAIASICYNEATAVVDGNVYRLLSRYFGIETPINSTQGIKEFKALAQKLLPKTNIGNYNQAVMEFGSRQCKPKNPDCSICSLNETCVAFQVNKIGQLPVKLKKAKVRTRYFNFLVFISNNKTILHQRTGKGIWENLYQFPLVETDKKLNQKQFYENKEVQNHLIGIDFDVSLYNEKDIIHKLSHQHLHTRFWIIKTSSSLKKSISISKLKTFPVPVLIDNFINTYKF